MKTHLIVTSFLVVTFVVIFDSFENHDIFVKDVLVQSFESKTILGEPVYNEIAWYEYPDKDVWMMNQSHFGLNPPADKKDRIVIVVDKTNVPKSAYFMQVKPGPLVWSEDLYTQKVANKVSCFICHANGLRTIRADASSGSIGLLDWAKINYMNYKMQSYGLVVEDPRHAIEDQNLSVPFRFRTAFQNEVLNVKNCTVCHDGKIRTQLTRQNAFSIEFLIEHKAMPPPEYALSKAEANKIKNFIRGL